MPDREAPLQALLTEFDGAADGAATTVRLQGEVDLETAPALQQRLDALLDDGVQTLVLDMSGVPFCDVAALNVLLRIHARLAERGGHVVVFGATRALRIMVAALGLEGRLSLAPCVVAAEHDGAEAGVAAFR
jgi:anti-anti-sigma factor